MSLTGQTIIGMKGNYRIGEEDGQDTIGTIYVARDDKKRYVTFRTIRSSLVPKTRFLDQYGRRADRLSQFRSPHVVRVFDYGKEGDVYYIVTEYVAGDRLSDVLKEQGPLEVSRALNIARQVTKGLHDAWAVKLVHGDLKPSSILLPPGRHDPIKLTDFGLAQSLVSSGITLTETVGLPYYISPEHTQVEHKLDARSDIFSLGVVLFEMLTGQVPFKGANAAEIIKKVRTESSPAVRTLREDLPEEVDVLVAKCLARDPAQRFQSHRDLERAIDRILRGQPGAQVQEAPAVSTPQVSGEASQRIERVAASLEELGKFVRKVEVRPPPPEPVPPPPLPKQPAWQRAGLLALLALALFLGFLGLILPGRSDQDATPDLQAQIESEVRRQIEQQPAPAAGSELIHTQLWQDANVCVDLIGVLREQGYARCVNVASQGSGVAIWYLTPDCSDAGLFEPSWGQSQALWNIQGGGGEPTYMRVMQADQLPYLVCTRSP